MPLTLTWWMVACAAPLLYLVLVQASGSRASVLRRLAAVTFLATVHAALALVTAVAYALLGIPHLTAVRDAFWTFAPAPLLQMLTVPFIGAPLRRRLIPRRLGRSGAARYRRPVVPAPVRQGVAWPTAPVASTPSESPEADSPALDPVVEATSAAAGDRAVGEPVVASASATTVASSS